MAREPPVIVTAHKPRSAPKAKATAEAASTTPRIVTGRKSKRGQTDYPDLSHEEVKRRGDAADALWRELVRRATGKQ